MALLRVAALCILLVPCNTFSFGPTRCLPRVRGILVAEEDVPERTALLSKAMQRVLGSMPEAAKQVLIEPTPSSVTQGVNAETFLGELFHCKSSDSIAAFVALRDDDPERNLVSARAVLSEREARRVRRWAEAKLATEGNGDEDSVDQAPTFQAALDWSTLENMIGKNGCERLCSRAMPFLERSAAAEDAGSNNDLQLSIGAIVRKYTPGERPFIGFHVDNNDATVNVALSTPSEYEGGRFLALVGGELRDATSAKAGDAVVHAWNVCHAVTAVHSGERWSLVLFLSNSWPPNHAGFFQKLQRPVARLQQDQSPRALD